jgi:hypothetical protein
MVSSGNHESECHSPACILDLPVLGLKLNNFTAFNARWPMPGPESGGVQNMWYSYRRSSVHFVSINTETDFAGAEEENTGDGHFAFLPAGHFAPDGAYMAWLAADLAAAAADPAVKWIVAGGHRPFEDLPADHAAALSALFNTAQLDFYFAGHGHTYSRYDASAWNDGAVHIMTGGSGSDETPWPKDQLVTPAPVAGRASPHAVGAPAPVAASDVYSLGVVTVSPTQLVYSQKRAPEGTEIDTISVARKTRHA